MGRTLAPIDFRVISKVYAEISRAHWFEPGDAQALALYLIHRYSHGQDEASRKAIAGPFAREWFRRGLGRFDALAGENRFARNLSVVTSFKDPLCAVLRSVFPLE